MRDEDEFAQVLYDGIRENGIDFVVGLPCSGFSRAQDLCLQDSEIRYVGVASEGTGLGLCAGTWLGGKRPAALMENLGLYVSMSPLLRGHMTFGIPTFLVLEYRGDAGEQEFWVRVRRSDGADPGGHATEVHRGSGSAAQLKPAMRDGLNWMDSALRPYTVLPGFNLTRPRHA